MLWAACAAVPAMERLSLAIGNNKGLAGEPRLFYATEEDARRIHTVMTELGGVALERGYLLLNRPAEDVERVLGEIEGRVKGIKLAGKSVELLVFYSGHASQEYLHMGGKAWPMENLRGFLRRVDANLKVTILDACNSGAFITRKGGTLAEPARFKEEDDLKARGSVVLTSSSALEFSHESKTLRGSLFSHFLLSGLRGAADYNRDHAVSLWEAYHFARLHTTRHLSGNGDRNQSPHFDFSVTGGKELILTSLDRGKSRVRFENCPPGDLYPLPRDLSEQWAEVDLRNRDTVEINLPRMAFVVHRVLDKELHVATANLRYRDRQVLRPADFQRTWIQDYRSKGGTALRMPGGLDLRMRLLRQVPEQVEEMFLPEIGVHVNTGPHRWGAHLGLVATETDVRQRILRRGLSLGGGWGFEKFLLSRLTVGPSAIPLSYGKRRRGRRAMGTPM